MSKKNTSKTQIEYIPMGEAKLHRRYKTKVVEDALSQIVERDGVVTGKSLLAEATADAHPLHDYFEWDDSVAGHRYRLAQATCMILATKYAAKIRQDRANSKVSNAIDEGTKVTRLRRLLPFAQQPGFGDRATVLSDAESRRAIIERKLGVLRSWCQSVIDIEELEPVREAVLAAIAI